MDQFLKLGSLSKLLLFLFLLFSTNLLNFFISTSLYSPCLLNKPLAAVNSDAEEDNVQVSDDPQTCHQNS